MKQVSSDDLQADHRCLRDDEARGRPEQRTLHPRGNDSPFALRAE